MTNRLLRWLLVLAVLLPAHSATAQRPSATAAPDGLWLTHNRRAVVAVTQCDERLCARIVGVLLDHPTDAMPVDYRGLSQCGLYLISDARQIRPGVWKGHIRDPRNGGVFDVEVRLDAQGRLALHGFIGVPLFGSTETWTRYLGAVPPDCRLPEAASGEARSHADKDGPG